MSQWSQCNLCLSSPVSSDSEDVDAPLGWTVQICSSIVLHFHPALFEFTLVYSLLPRFFSSPFPTKCTILGSWSFNISFDAAFWVLHLRSAVPYRALFTPFITVNAHARAPILLVSLSLYFIPFVFILVSSPLLNYPLQLFSSLLLLFSIFSCPVNPSATA